MHQPAACRPGGFKRQSTEYYRPDGFIVSGSDAVGMMIVPARLGDLPKLGVNGAG